MSKEFHQFCYLNHNKNILKILSTAYLLNNIFYGNDFVNHSNNNNIYNNNKVNNNKANMSYNETKRENYIKNDNNYKTDDYNNDNNMKL